MTMGGLPRVIALHGKKRSGKGSVASRLAAAHGYEIVRFADPLKDMLRVLLAACGLDDETVERCIEGDLKQAPIDFLDGATTRQCMQAFDKWRSMVCDPMWIRIALRRVDAILESGGRAVVEDLRLPGELAAMEEIGASLWLVSNPKAEAEAAADAHVTERGLPEAAFRVRLVNDGSFADLHAQVDAAVACPDCVGARIVGRSGAPLACGNPDQGAQGCRAAV